MINAGRIRFQDRACAYLSQVLASIGLAEDHDTSRLELLSLSSRARSHAETERLIVHAVNNDTAVLGAILAPASGMSLQNAGLGISS
jgi:hypothetical protein